MTIPLSPMDYYFFRPNLYTIQFVFEYLGDLDTELFDLALRKTEHFCPAPFCRLVTKSKTEMVLQMGPPIIPAVRYIDYEPNLQIPVDARPYLVPITNAPEEPLFSILITKTPTRSVVGFSFSHIVGDGASFFKFFKTLCQMMRGEISSNYTFNDRSILEPKGNIHENPADQLFSSTGYCFPRPAAITNVSTEVMYFKKSDIAQIKQDANHSVSANDIIMASLAKRFNRNIPLHDGKFIIRCPVDYRKIFKLPENYFGNAVRDAVCEFDLDEIESSSLLTVAKKIRSCIENTDHARVAESLISLKSLRLRYGINVFDTSVGCPGLLVSNFSRFPIAEMNLGLGSPIGFHHASLNPRLALILNADDGFEVRFKRPVE